MWGGGEGELQKANTIMSLDTVLARENGAVGHHLSQYASNRPDINCKQENKHTKTNKQTNKINSKI